MNYFIIITITLLILVIFFTDNNLKPQTKNYVLDNYSPNKIAISLNTGYEEYEKKAEDILNYLGNIFVPQLENEINTYISKPINVSKDCNKVKLDNLQIGKCFSLNSSGYWNGKSEFISDVSKSACYVGCHTLNSYKWTCCKLPGFLDCGDCPSTLCKKKCGKGLISWSAGLDYFKGFKNISFNLIEVLKIQKINNGFTLNLQITGQPKEDVEVSFHAGIGGLLSLIPNLITIPTRADGKVKTDKLFVTTLVNIDFVCDNNKIQISKVDLKNVHVNIKGNISIGVDTWPYIDKLTKISSTLANKMSNSVNSLLKKLTDEYLNKILENVLENITNNMAKKYYIPNVDCSKLI